MSWFNRKKQAAKETDVEHKATIQIVANTQARKNAKVEAERVNQDLNELLKQDDITIQIWVGAGGQLPSRKSAGGKT